MVGDLYFDAGVTKIFLATDIRKNLLIESRS